MRKLISILLCLVMLFGMLPMEVFAVDVIFQVDVLIDEPVVGQEASFIATAYGPNYHINTITRTDYYNGVLWYDVTAEDYLAPGDTFVAEHVYRVSIRVASDDTNSYLFSTNDGDAVVRSTINGNRAQIYGNAREIGLEYTFPPCECLPGQYKVTFYYLYDDIVEVRYTDTDNNIPFFSPTRDGYYFYRWYTDLNFRNEAPHYTDEDLVLYARWVDPEDICYLRFHAYNDPSDVLTVDVVCGESISGEVSPPWNPNMYFVGWYTDPNFENKFYYYESVEEDMDIYPRFVNYSDLCEIQIYDSVDASEASYGVEIPIGDCYSPMDPQNGPDDLCFVGWYTDRSFNNKYDESEPVSGRVISLFPRYVDYSETITVTIYLSPDATECTAGVNILPGDCYKPAEPGQEGMIFEGWYTDRALTQRYYTDQPVTESVSIFPKFIPKNEQCTVYVYYDADSPTPFDSVIVDKGEYYNPYYPLEEPEDLYFVGWYTDRDFQNKYDPYKPLTEDVSIFPKFLDESQVCFVRVYRKADDEDPSAWATVEKGECYTPATPAEEDMVFAGWYTDRNLTIPYHDTMPLYTDEIELFGKFIPEGDVCFIWLYEDADSPEPYDEVMVEKGECYDPYWPEYEPEGLYFAGFYTDRGYNNKYDPEVPLVKNVSIFPKFVDRSQVCFIDVYRMADDLKPSASIYVVKGECYTPATPGEEGMTFAGWYTDRALTKPYDDKAPLYVDSIELFAKYIPEMLDAPKLVSAVNAAGGVKVTWQAVEYAEKYRVFVKSNGSGWKAVADTTGLNYTHTGVVSGTTYTYTVRCISADGKSNRSVYDRAGISVTYIDAPAVSSITSAYGGIQLKWSACGGAAKYRVFKKSGKSWKAIATVTGLAYIDSDVTAGTKYTYTLRAYNSAGTEYSYYNSAGWSLTFVDSPKVTDIQNVATGAKLTWVKVNGAAKYRVFIKSSGKWVKLADTTSTSYLHTAAKGGTIYTYTIRSINSSNKFIGSYNAAGWKNTFIAVPPLPTLTNTSSGVKITIKKCAGAVKYRIFRKTASTKWVKLADTTSLTCIDKSAKNGIKYYYTVRCISSDGKKFTSAYNTSGKAIVCRR